MCRSQGTNLIDDLVSLQDLDDAFGEFNAVALGEVRFFYAAEVTQFSMVFKMNPVATARFDFSLESLDIYRINNRSIIEDLVSNVPLQRCVPGQVNGSHSAGTEFRDDLVTP